MSPSTVPAAPERPSPPPKQENSWLTVLPSSCHSHSKYGFQRRGIAMPRRPPSGLRRNHHLHQWLGRRQIPSAWTDHHFQLADMSHWLASYGIPLELCCPLLWRFPCYGRFRRQRAPAMSYQANNIRGQWKRAFASATFVSFGGIGGIAGSLVFRSEDAPSYRPGLYACMACAALPIITVTVLTLDFRRLNGQADRGEKELECDDVSSSSQSRRVWMRANVVAG